MFHFSLTENNSKQPKKDVYIPTLACYHQDMNKKQSNVILKQPHEADCWAVKTVAEYDWYSPWYMPQELPFLGDVLGGYRGTTTMWRVFRCNSTNCRAWGVIRQVAIENFIHDELNGVKK